MIPIEIRHNEILSYIGENISTYASCILSVGEIAHELIQEGLNPSIIMYDALLRERERKTRLVYLNESLSGRIHNIIDKYMWRIYPHTSNSHILFDFIDVSNDNMQILISDLMNINKDVLEICTLCVKIIVPNANQVYDELLEYDILMHPNKINRAPISHTSTYDIYH